MPETGSYGQTWYVPMVGSRRDDKDPGPVEARQKLREMMSFTDFEGSNKDCRARVQFRGRRAPFMRCGSAGVVLTQVASFHFIAAEAVLCLRLRWAERGHIGYSFLRFWRVPRSIQSLRSTFWGASVSTLGGGGEGGGGPRGR
jgi:hypothetical protein